MKGSDPVCRLVPDSECTPLGDKIQYSFILNQTREITTNHLGRVDAQLKTDAVGRISLLIATIKREATTLKAEAITTIIAEICDRGSASINDICIECSPGYYEVEHACILCGKGTYSESSGVTQCTDCTGTKSTDDEGSNDEAACVDGSSIKIVLILIGSLIGVIAGVVTCFYKRSTKQITVTQSAQRDEFSQLPTLNPPMAPMDPSSSQDSPPAYNSKSDLYPDLPDFSQVNSIYRRKDSSQLQDVLDSLEEARAADLTLKAAQQRVHELLFGCNSSSSTQSLSNFSDQDNSSSTLADILEASDVEKETSS